VAALAHDLRMACMRVSRRVRFETTTQLAPHQFSVLVRLSEQPRTAGDLAEQERVTAPSMSRTVGALVERGLVQRAADARDGRVVVLSLTALGEQVIAQERAQRDAWMAVRLEGLSEDDRDVLRRATALLEEVVAR
jgi:DNA-binding MarR family transcriptional regulator